MMIKVVVTAIILEIDIAQCLATPRKPSEIGLLIMLDITSFRQVGYNMASLQNNCTLAVPVYDRQIVRHQQDRRSVFCDADSPAGVCHFT